MTSAWAGAAKPTIAAARPVAAMDANPNFFISVPSSFVCGLFSLPSDRLNAEVRGLIPLAAIDRRLAAIATQYDSQMAKLELSRSLSMTPDDAWAHASNFSTLGEWLAMHEGWRSDLPDELEVGTTL